MNDYFHMLAETALGMREALSPLIGPVFSPLPAQPDEAALFAAPPAQTPVRTEIQSPVAHAAPEIHVHHHAAAPPAAVTYPVIERREEVRQSHHETVKESVVFAPPAPPLAVPAPTPAAIPAAREMFERVTERTVAHEPVRTVDKRVESHTLERSPGKETIREFTQERLVERDRVHQPAVVERIRTAQAAPQFRVVERIAPPKEPEPVQIVIDRIEIRATSPAATPTPPQPHRPAPVAALSLDDFMKRGRG
jgi:hypothetical protein